jgi:hypothetical protein
MPRVRSNNVVVATTTVAVLMGSALTMAPGAYAVPGSPASENPGLAGDINGDGYRDVVATAPDATIDGQSAAGAITVAYGSPDGLGAEDTMRATLSQSTPGVPGVPEPDDRFGADIAVGDFDSDGFADVAVGTSGEDVTGDNDAGLVQVLWGSTTGLSGDAATLSEPGRFDHDAHGQALAAGDFDGDGHDDLATGNTSSQAWLYAGGMTRSGGTGGTHPLGQLNTWNFEVDALTVGDLNRDGLADLLVRHSRMYVSGGDNEPLGLELIGSMTTGSYATVFGDFDGNGYTDIVQGREDDHGGVYVYSPGAPMENSEWDIDFDRRYRVNQRDFGYPGDGDAYDRFATALAAGDVNGDGYDDLVVGDSREDIGSVADAGFVVVSYGSPNGLTNERQTFDQSLAGVPGVNEPGDGFGSQVLLSDVNGDGRDDLTLTTGQENGGNGVLVVLPSTGDLIGTAGARALSATDFGLPTAGRPLLGTEIR